MKTNNTKQNATIAHASGCPACSEKKALPLNGQIYRCTKCDAIYGQCYLGDSYSYVLPQMTAEDVPADRTRYYDFTCVGSNGITRRHGWYDPQSKLITQVG
jgi:ribosomal protein L37AE/L43A